MHTLSPTPSSPHLGRRAALSTLVAGASAAGITAGVAASVTPPGRDVELIALCGQFDALERELQAGYVGASTSEAEDRAEANAGRIRDLQEPLLARICNARWNTMAGAAAIATSLHLWEAGEVDIGNDDPEANTNERLLAALLRGLVGRA